MVKSAASVETTEQSQSTAAASRSTGPPGAPPHGRSDPDLHSTQKSPVASDSSRSTLDSAFKHSITQGSRLRLKAEGPASPSSRKKWKTKNRASSRSPTPPTRTTPAESIGCFCRSAFCCCCFFFFAAAAAPRCRGSVHSSLRSAVPPPAPCIAKVLGCVVQRGWYSTATMAPAPWNPGVLGAVVRYILISRLISKPHCQLITA